MGDNSIGNIYIIQDKMFVGVLLDEIEVGKFDLIIWQSRVIRACAK